MGPAISFEAIATQAFRLGASLVGAASVAKLLGTPSHRLSGRGRRVAEGGALVVIALSHPVAQPDMDWWDGYIGRTPGNRRLATIAKKLKSWFRAVHCAESRNLPYQICRGGIFLKDAAAIAGLGVVGKNNLLVTPQYGPRIRLGALWLDRSVDRAESNERFAPCDGCDAPCQRACPMEGFHGGSYQPSRCMRQMARDEACKIEIGPPLYGVPARYGVAYCRRCELACPVGS